MAEDSKATGSTGGAGKSPAQSLALYRKYRPATFAEVRGQEHVTDPLRQALRSGRINHAYLFSGPRGCGKTSSARILARSLNCVNGPTPEPCGVCDSCVALAPSGPGSIDVIEIDAASHGGVDDARDLRERAFYAPVAGRFKIYIIDEAHMVTQQGFNALLKLVEEPPPHLKFIFATTEPEKVIPTIRSRTHHYPFRLMAPSVMRDLAEEILNSERVTFDPAVLPLVVRAGGGSARDTLSILDQLLAGSDEAGIKYDRAVSLLGYTDASLLDEMVDAFAAADGAAVFRAVNRVIEGGHEPRRFATDMLDRFRDLIVLASVPDAIDTGLLDVPPDRAEVLRGQAERYGLASLTRAADLVASGLDQMRGATSPRLLLELMCAQVLLPAAGGDERSLLARLERLEAGAVAPRPTDDYPERRPASPPSVPAPPRGPASDPAVPVRSAPGAAAAERERPAPGPDYARSTTAGTGSGVGDQAPHQPAAAEQPTGSSRQPAAPAAPADSPGPAAQPEPSRPAPAEPARPAAAFTHAPGAPGAPGPQSTPAAPAARGGEVTADTLRQGWPRVVDAVKAKGRVASILVGNASVASYDEGVLTLRFPRQGDVRGFSGSKYEDLLKQAITAIFGVNVVVRSMGGPGSDAPSPGRRPAPGPPGPPAFSPQPSPAPAQAEPAAFSPAPASPVSPASAAGPGSSGAAPAGYPQQAPPPPVPANPGLPNPASSGFGPGPASPASGGTGNGSGGTTPPFGSGGVSGGDLPPLPPPPDDDEDFDPDDEDMSAPGVDDLTGMALVKRELGGQVIAEFED